MVKKVMQTVTGLGGNCEGATIATLLGLELSEIPDFWEGCDIETPALPENGIIYQQNLNNFLEKYGYKMLSLGVSSDPSERDQQWVTDISKHLDIKHLVAGISPRGHMHSVIYEHGELWHDPHPEGGGVIPCQICLLVPIFKEKVKIISKWYNPNYPELIYGKDENSDIYLNSDKIVYDTWCEDLIQFEYPTEAAAKSKLTYKYGRKHSNAVGIVLKGKIFPMNEVEFKNLENELMDFILDK